MGDSEDPEVYLARSGFIRVGFNFGGHDGVQLSSCLQETLREFFPDVKGYNPVTDARFKNPIPYLYDWGETAITLGHKDIYFNPDKLSLNGGNLDNLWTIVEEIAHAEQFLKLWAAMPNQQRPVSGGVYLAPLPPTYEDAQGAWELNYIKSAAKGWWQNGDSYKNDVEKEAKNRTFDILSKIRTNPKYNYNLCGFSLYGTLNRPNY